MQTRESDVPQAERVSAIFVRHPLWEDALALLTGTAPTAGSASTAGSAPTATTERPDHV